MPGIYCSVRQCSNSRLKNPGLSFHRFPRDEQQRNAWIARCQPKTAKLDLTRHYICSEHFKPEMFKIDMRAKLMNLPGRRELVVGAIPEMKLSSSREETPREKRMKTKTEREGRKAIIRELPLKSEESQPIIRKNVLFDERRINVSMQNTFETCIDYKEMYRELLEKYEQKKRENIELIRENEELRSIARNTNYRTSS